MVLVWQVLRRITFPFLGRTSCLNKKGEMYNVLFLPMHEHVRHSIWFTNGDLHQKQIFNHNFRVGPLYFYSTYLSYHFSLVMESMF